MSGVIKYIPLTFVSSSAEKERLIRNTVLLRHFASEAGGNVMLSHYIESTQYGFNASAKDSGTNRFVRISDISNGEIAWDKVPFCECDDPETYLLKKHDIVVARTGGTTGKSYMVSAPPKGSIYAGYLIRVRANSKTNPAFLSVFLNSYLYWSQITSLNRDEFRPSVNAEKLKELQLPKFDRAVQDQIVRLSNSPTEGADSSIQAELNAVLAKRNGHESIVAEIENQQSLLAKLKQAILQEAIQGKLTEDWRAAHPDVEPASQLFKRIQAEKSRLIAAKKLRPEKPLPKITPSEIAFDIPKGWEWVRLIELSEKTGSGSTPSGGKTAYSTSGIPFLRSQNVHDDGLVLNDVARISAAIHKRMEGTTVFPADLLLNITGGSIGRCAIASDEIVEANVNQHVAIIRPILRQSGKYLHAVILSPYFQGKIEDAQTGAGREGLPKNKMDRIVLPLPPLAEQAAIVERMEALMTTCRSLEAEIEQSRTDAAHLLQSVLKEAFAPAS
jgi:type I restriction enzyme S subunit